MQFLQKDAVKFATSEAYHSFLFGLFRNVSTPYF